ncbi:hypothetical protein ACHAWF_002992, partial [Thalassiosira exigua]
MESKHECVLEAQADAENRGAFGLPALIGARDRLIQERANKLARFELRHQVEALAAELDLPDSPDDLLKAYKGQEEVLLRGLRMAAVERLVAKIGMEPDELHEELGAIREKEEARTEVEAEVGNGGDDDAEDGPVGGERPRKQEDEAKASVRGVIRPANEGDSREPGQEAGPQRTAQIGTADDGPREKLQDKDGKRGSDSALTIDQRRRAELRAVMKIRSLDKEERKARMEEIKEKYDRMLMEAWMERQATATPLSSKKSPRHRETNSCASASESKEEETAATQAIVEQEDESRLQQHLSGGNPACPPTRDPISSNTSKEWPPTSPHTLDQRRRAELRAAMKDMSLSKEERRKRMDAIKEKYARMARGEGTRGVETPAAEPTSLRGGGGGTSVVGIECTPAERVGGVVNGTKGSDASITSSVARRISTFDRKEMVPEKERVNVSRLTVTARVAAFSGSSENKASPSGAWREAATVKNKASSQARPVSKAVNCTIESSSQLKTTQREGASLDWGTEGSGQPLGSRVTALSQRFKAMEAELSHSAEKSRAASAAPKERELYVERIALRVAAAINDQSGKIDANRNKKTQRGQVATEERTDFDTPRTATPTGTDDSAAGEDE